MKRKWWIIVIFLVPLVLIAWWASSFFVRTDKEKIVNPFYKIKKGNLSITVVEKGRLEPKEVIQLSPYDMFKDIITPTSSANTSRVIFPSDNDVIWEYRSSGNIPTEELPLRRFTILRLVPKGTRVKKGDLLVEFDSKPLEDMIEETEEKLKSARENFESILNNLKTQKRDMELKVQRNKLALKKGLEAYDKLWEDVARGKISEDSIKFKEQRLNLKELKIRLEDIEREDRIIKIISREYSSFDVNSDEIPKKDIPDDLQNEPQEIIAKHMRSIIKAIDPVEKQQERLDQLKKYPQPLALYSPTPGHLFYGTQGYGSGYSWVNEDKVLEGETCYLKSGLVYVSNTVDMKVVINVDAININKVKKDQKAKITPDAFSDLKLKGSVTEVSEIPGTGRYSRRRYSRDNESTYSVIVSVDDTDPRLRPKMSVKTEIMCEEVKDVIFVPLEAVLEKDDRKICYVLKQGNPVERTIKTGKSNEDFVVIEEGLQEGEEIYLYDPFVKK